MPIPAHVLRDQVLSEANVQENEQELVHFVDNYLNEITPFYHNDFSDDDEIRTTLVQRINIWRELKEREVPLNQYKKEFEEKKSTVSWYTYLTSGYSADILELEKKANNEFENYMVEELRSRLDGQDNKLENLKKVSMVLFNNGKTEDQKLAKAYSEYEKNFSELFSNKNIGLSQEEINQQKREILRAYYDNDDLEPVYYRKKMYQEKILKSELLEKYGSEAEVYFLKELQPFLKFTGASKDDFFSIKNDVIEKYCAMRSNGFYVDVASIMYNKEFMEIQEIKFNYIKTLPKEKLNDFKDMLVLEGMNYFDSNIKPYLISLNYDESAVNLEYLAFSEKYADFCINRLKEGYWEREAEPWGPGKDAFLYKYNAFSFDLKRFDETERNILFEKKRKELFKKIDESVDAESKDNLKNT
ncbi:MAG: hypothetical protein RLZ35_159, partial [Pseudomonadota bacterium]